MELSMARTIADSVLEHRSPEQLSGALAAISAVDNKSRADNDRISQLRKELARRMAVKQSIEGGK